MSLTFSNILRMSNAQLRPHSKNFQTKETANQRVENPNNNRNFMENLIYQQANLEWHQFH